MNRSFLRVAAPATLVLALAACGSDDAVPRDGTTPRAEASEAAVTLSGQLSGAGASSQESAVQAWIAGFQATHPDVSVAYDPVGSGGGRTQFLDGGVQFAGSDAMLKEDELARAAERCAPGQVIEAPLYISPIAVIFNLEGVDRLNMSAETIARVFDGQITQWDDPAIAEANPDVQLPDLPITPVNRSDESGTTENFTEYLAAAAGDAWPYEPSGDWPRSGTQSAQGTSGVVQTVNGAQGTIGYADASQAGDLGTVAVQVGDEYVPYSPEAAAAVVDASPRAEGRPDTSLAIELQRDTSEAGAYPIVLVSYTIACTAYDDAEDAELVRAWLEYVASEEGQQQAAGAAGSAPISAELRDEVLAIAEQIS